MPWAEGKTKDRLSTQSSRGKCTDTMEKEEDLKKRREEVPRRGSHEKGFEEGPGERVLRGGGGRGGDAIGKRELMFVNGLPLDSEVLGRGGWEKLRIGSGFFRGEAG